MYDGEGIGAKKKKKSLRPRPRPRPRLPCFSTFDATRKMSLSNYAIYSLEASFMACLQDTLPEWSKGVDSSSTSASCVGSNPTGVI